MNTTQLLFGMMWRGAAWGLLGGTMLGAAYGAIFANVLFLFGLAQTTSPVELGDIPGALAGIIVLALIGSVMGALFGVPTGAIVGWLDGLLVGIVTRLFFYPFRNAQKYRRVIAIIVAALTSVASWVCFFVIMLFYANREKANLGALALVVALPALIAGVAAAFLSRLVAEWYAREMRGEERTETASEVTR